MTNSYEHAAIINAQSVVHFFKYFFDFQQPLKTMLGDIFHQSSKIVKESKQIVFGSSDAEQKKDRSWKQRISQRAEIFQYLLIEFCMSSLTRDKIFNSSKTYSNKSFKTSEDSHLMCNSCKSSRQDLQTQISQLKDKAHQSFMQVLQIQQLHDEEIQQLREEFDEKEASYLKEIEDLKRELTHMKNEIMVLDRNMRRHSFDFGPKELLIENIDAIICQEGENSYLDESQLIQFKDLISVKNGNDYVQSLRRQIYRDFKFVSNNKTQIEKMFILIKDLKDENIYLHAKNQQLIKRLSEAETQAKHMKNTLENVNKQTKFMSQHLKRLGNEKLKLQRKVSELEKHRNQEDYPISPSAKDLLCTHTGFTRPNFKSLSPNAQKEELKHEQSVVNILQVSKCSFSQLSESRREINELNYAKFMIAEDVQGSESKASFKKRKGSVGKQE